MSAEIKLHTGNFKYVYEPSPSHYVNDHCIIYEGGIYHLFHILGEVGKGCYTLGNEVIIGHATSPDLYHWRREEDALVYDPALEWEGRGIYAPYVLKNGDRFYMFYSSHNIPKAQYMCLATSEDLFQWRKHLCNPLFVPSLYWAYWDRNEATSCRDPHVIKHEKHGFIMYWVADMKRDRQQSCIAASVSRDLFHWQEVGPILIRRWSVGEDKVCKTESPCVIVYENKYYLFYRHGNGTKYCVSDDPLNWHGRDSQFLCTAHAAEILQFNDKWYITSCSRPPEDTAHVHDRTRGLYIAHLHWENGTPVVD